MALALTSCRSECTSHATGPASCPAEVNHPSEHVRLHSRHPRDSLCLKDLALAHDASEWAQRAFTYPCIDSFLRFSARSPLCATRELRQGIKKSPTFANADISFNHIVGSSGLACGRAWSTMTLGPTVPLNTQGVGVLVVDAVLAALASIWTALRFHSRRMRKSPILPEDWMILVALVRPILLSNVETTWLIFAKVMYYGMVIVSYLSMARPRHCSH